MSAMGRNQSPIVDRTLKKRENIQYGRRSLNWCFINIFLAFIMYMEMSCGYCLDFLPFEEDTIFYAEMILVFLFVLNAFADFLKYLYSRFSGSQVELTPRQKRLLGVRASETGFRTAAPRALELCSPEPIFSSSLPLRSPMSMSSAIPAGVSPLSRSLPTHRSMSNSPTGSNSPYGSMSYDTSPHGTNYTSSPMHHSFSPNPSPATSSPIAGKVSPGNYAHGASGSFLDHSYAARGSFNVSFNRSGTTSPLSPVNSMSPMMRDRMETSGLRSRLHNVSAKSSPLRSEDYITDQKSLDQYLKEYDEKEYKNQLGSPENAPTNSASFWNFNRTLSDYTPVLRKYKYQIACRSPQSTKSPDTDPDDPATYRGEEVWSKLGISIHGEELDRWIENLRKWLSQTILVRLVQEIEFINKELSRLVSEDMQIGEVSISVLKQMAMTKGQHIPTLNTVIPYLEVCTNQEYMLQRIKDLSKGGCMSGFKWSGGNDFKGKSWGQHLPTDSAIVMHVLCSYLDSRLPPHPRFPDGKTFTNQHFMKTPDKPDMKHENFCIYQSKINPPHYKVIWEDDTWDLPKGRNNMFYAILLFLLQVKLKQHGMLGRVNLGMSGINILWVLD